MLATSLILTLAGFLLRDGDLIALAVTGLALVPAMAAIGWWNLRHLEVAADLPDRVIAEERFPCRLKVRNHRPLGDAFHLRVEQTLPGGAILRFEAPWTPAEGESTVEMSGSVPRRGIFGGSWLRLVSDFPFGWFEARARGHLAESMLVLPRPLVPPAFEQAVLAFGDEGRETKRTRLPVLGELHGLRAFRSGDPLKFIHWPASTRGLGLMVREHDRAQTHPRLCGVVFHSASPGRSLIRPEDFEAALRLLAGVVRRLEIQGVAAEVRADFLGWDPVPCRTTAEIDAFHASLAAARRARKSRIDQVQSALRALPASSLLVVISDLPKAGWLDLVWPQARPPQLCVLDASDASRSQPVRLRHRPTAR